MEALPVTHPQKNSERDNCHPPRATCSSAVTVNATSLPSWSMFKAGGVATGQEHSSKNKAKIICWVLAKGYV